MMMIGGWGGGGGREDKRLGGRGVDGGEVPSDKGGLDKGTSNDISTSSAMKARTKGKSGRVKFL